MPARMLNRRHLLQGAAAGAVIGLAGGCGTTRAAASPARLQRHALLASAHVAARDVNVWLPPGYDGGSARHRVLYMHDGQNLFDPASGMGHGPWAVDAALARIGTLPGPPLPIVVGIDNTAARWREYAPAAAVAALPEPLHTTVVTAGGGVPLSDDYLRFLVGELKPYIDAHYRTRPGRDDTLVAGSSMGALISLYALACHPDTFGAAGCLSTHWLLTTSPALVSAGPGPDLEACGSAFIDWLAAHLPRAGRHRLYFDHGTVGLDSLYAPFQSRVDALVARHGYRRGVDLQSLVFEGADHHEAAWRARLETPLRFLLLR